MDEEIKSGMNPFHILTGWLKSASAMKTIREPSAMTLSTLSSGGGLSSRVVLMRGLDERGLVFFTNYQSRKGQELSAHPMAAANFYWDSWARQVRIQGRVQKTSRQESVDYWNSRPRESQLGGMISQQSHPLGSRQDLLALMNQAEVQYQNRPVPCPEHWGGFRLAPEQFEFWIGRENRLHDRYQFSLQQGLWQMVRLYP